jgi:hypothetical protein
MADATQRQYDEAVKRLKVAEEALEVALEYQTDPEDGAARWAKVRALQAQAQLHVLHSISYDLRRDLSNVRLFSLRRISVAST